MGALRELERAGIVDYLKGALENFLGSLLARLGFEKFWCDGVFTLLVDNDGRSMDRLLGIGVFPSFGFAPFELEFHDDEVAQPADRIVFRFGLRDECGNPRFWKRWDGDQQINERPNCNHDWFIAAELSE